MSKQSSRNGTSRFEWVVVILLCVIALGLELRFAHVAHFGFDENWHVFMAAIQPFDAFMRELKWETHPPLQHALMRWGTPLSGSELWPRSISMVASLITIVLAFLCAKEMQLSRSVALLTASVFAVSNTHLSLGICVRSYSLSTMLTMASFFFLLRILRDPTNGSIRRDQFGFAVFAVLAMWATYNAMLVVLGSLVVLSLEAWRRPALASALLPAQARLKDWIPASLLALGGLGVLAWLQWTHGREFVGHVGDFFPAAGDSRSAFALRGFVTTLDEFVPLGLSSQRAPLLAPAVLIAALVWILLGKTRGGDPEGLRASAAVILLVVWSGILLLAFQYEYPHGGKMRHQFVLFPFLVLVLAVLVDEVNCRLRARWARIALWAALIAGTTAAAIGSARRGPFEEFSPTAQLYPSEIGQVLRQRQNDEALYASKIVAVALFSHLRERRWTLRDHAGDSELYVVEMQGEPPIQVLRQTRPFWIEAPLDEDSARRMAESMRRWGVTRAWALLLGLEMQPVADRQNDSTTRDLLRAHGVELVRRIVFPSGEALLVEVAD